jgi:biopolymer transport protein ExbD/biopolymer transport protein TolR
MGSGGGTNKAVSEINVTPLIDVLLVLLIIFMVIVPVTPKGLDTTIVVSIQANGNGEPSYLINQDVFAKSQLEPKLQEIFSTRQGGDRVMFVKGDDALDFSKVAEVIDMGHQAGVDNIGLITPRVEAGQ